MTRASPYLSGQPVGDLDSEAGRLKGTWRILEAPLPAGVEQQPAEGPCAETGMIGDQEPLPVEGLHRDLTQQLGSLRPLDGDGKLRPVDSARPAAWKAAA